jgi:hypothetical protein
MERSSPSERRRVTRTVAVVGVAFDSALVLAGVFTAIVKSVVAGTGVAVLGLVSLAMVIAVARLDLRDTRAPADPGT